MVSCKFCKIYKKSFSYRLPPVAASVHVIPHSLSISHILSWLLKGYLPFHFPVENIKWTLKTYIYLIYTGTGTYTWHIFHFPVNSHFPQYINKNEQHKIGWHNGTPHVCVFFFYWTNSTNLVRWVCSDFQHQFAHQGTTKIQQYFLVGNFKSTCLKSRRLWN